MTHTTADRIVMSAADGCAQARRILIHLRNEDDDRRFLAKTLEILVHLDHAEEMLSNLAASLPALAEYPSDACGNVPLGGASE